MCGRYLHILFRSGFINGSGSLVSLSMPLQASPYVIHKYLPARTHTENLCNKKLSFVWNNVIANNDIALESKWEVFKAVYQSVAMHGTQVWGTGDLIIWEWFKDFFIKEIFSLPRSFHNYIMFLETNVGSLFLNGFKLHFEYIFIYNCSYQASKSFIGKNCKPEDWMVLGMSDNK